MTSCGAIGAGLLALIGVQRGDGHPEVTRLLERLLDYRVFADEAGRMNKSLRDTNGGLLLVPQFTLAADTSSGTRPGFSTAAEPAQARILYDQLLEAASEADDEVLAKYLDGETITDPELEACLRKGVKESVLAPVLLGSAVNQCRQRKKNNGSNDWQHGGHAADDCHRSRAEKRHLITCIEVRRV